MVSFRLSPEEYDTFRTLCSSHGVRSLSDLARTAMQKLAASKHQVDPLWFEVGTLRDQIQSLSREVDRLSHALETREAKGNN